MSCLGGRAALESPHTMYEYDDDEEREPRRRWAIGLVAILAVGGWFGYQRLAGDGGTTSGPEALMFDPPTAPTLPTIPESSVSESTDAETTVAARPAPPVTAKPSFAPDDEPGLDDHLDPGAGYDERGDDHRHDHRDNDVGDHGADHRDGSADRSGVAASGRNRDKCARDLRP